MNFVSDVNASKTIILPDKWCWTTLDELMKKIVDGTHHTPTYIENGVPFLSVKDIRDGKIFFDNCKYISQEEHEELCKRCHPEFGDLLITKSGTIGRCAVIKTKQEFSLFVSVALLKPANNVNIDYISLAFQSWFQNINVQNDITGTAIKNFHLVDFRQLSLPIAPLNKQRRIVAKIEALKARSACVKESLSTIPALLDQFRQSVLAAAFRGDLTAEWRSQNPDVEPAEVLLEKIRAERRRKWEEAELAKMEASGKVPLFDKWKEKYKEPLAADDSELPELPDSWCWAMVQNVAEVQLGRQRSPENHTGKYMHKYLRAANVTWSGLDLSDVKEMNFSPDDFKRFQLKYGDILLNEVSGSQFEVGKPAIWRDEIPDCCIQNTLIRVRPLLPTFEFLYYHFLWNAKSGAFGNFSKGISIHHLGSQLLTEWIIQVPPIEEQKEIVSRIHKFLKAIDNIEQKYQQTKGDINQLDQSILFQAFSGNLVPQDPNDEPASVLLERIRSEREKTLTPKTKRTKKTNPVSQPTQMELEL